MVKRTDYGENAVSAARSVLIELAHLLGEYRDHFVIVGGWVPELLIDHPEELHVGSLDVDIALDHRNVPEEAYRTLQELLLARGYTQGKQPFIFHRSVRDVVVQVDFLSGEYGGTGGARRHQPFQDLKARKARGADLAFELNTTLEITGELPGGGRDRVKVKVASIVSFIVMKVEALKGRLKEKDAWDIDFCLRHFAGGLDAIVETFRPHAANKLVQEALAILSEKFESVDSVGPTFIANFDELDDPEDRALRQRDAYERIQYLLTKLRGPE